MPSNASSRASSGSVQRRHRLQRPQVPQLVVDFFRRRDGLSDFVAHDVPELATKAVHGNLDGAFGHGQFRAELLVGQLGIFSE